MDGPVVSSINIFKAKADNTNIGWEKIGTNRGYVSIFCIFEKEMGRWIRFLIEQQDNMAGMVRGAN